MTNEPKTRAGRALLASLPPEWHVINTEIMCDHILAIEAEKDEEYERVVDFYRKQRDEAAAAPAAELLELAEQYHSGHSVTSSPCRCRQCKQLAKLRKRASEPAAAEPPALAELVEKASDWHYSDDFIGKIFRWRFIPGSERAASSSERSESAQPPPCPECGARYGR